MRILLSSVGLAEWWVPDGVLKAGDTLEARSNFQIDKGFYLCLTSQPSFSAPGSALSVNNWQLKYLLLLRKSQRQVILTSGSHQDNYTKLQ